ncbi:MAG TPA: hypothetical protein VEG44_02570 [Candidatus Acidoferrales bacterium]|nr:hypothetical protein [Candidatus Acidoferrales bacterium]
MVLYGSECSEIMWESLTELKNLKMVPMPIDIHVARATLATGVVKGHFNGKMNELFENIREAWFESVAGLKAKR